MKVRDFREVNDIERKLKAESDLGEPRWAKYRNGCWAKLGVSTRSIYNGCSIPLEPFPLYRFKIF